MESKTFIIFLGFCIGGVSLSHAAESASCKSTLQAGGLIKVCHSQNESNSGTSSPCPPGEGIAVNKLTIAPKSAHGECSRISIRDLLDAKCLQNFTPHYFNTVFDILDKVSGKNEISDSTFVSRFVFSKMSSGDQQDSSAYIVFKRSCKPAIVSEQDHAINLCSENTVNSSRVYLTLQGTENIPSELSMCRCTLTPIDSVQLKAMDVRLQPSKGDHACSAATSLQIKTENKDPRNLRCEDREVLYGFDELYSGKTKPVTLTLSSVSSDAFPASVWIEVAGKTEDSDWGGVSVKCEGFKAITGPNPGSNNMALIVGASIGGAVVFIGAVIGIVLCKRRNRDGSGDGGPEDNIYYTIEEEANAQMLSKAPQPPPLPGRPSSESDNQKPDPNAPPKPKRRFSDDKNKKRYEYKHLSWNKQETQNAQKKDARQENQPSYDHLLLEKADQADSEFSEKVNVRESIKKFEHSGEQPKK